MNPNLIEHETDGEDYADACPTIGTLMVAHFSRPEPQLHAPAIYEADGLFFAMHPERRMYVREAFKNEYDFSANDEAHQNRPKLWVLVVHMTAGHHLLLPCWRGRAFWRELSSDQDVANALHLMSVREGMSLSEWYSYIADQRVRRADAKRQAKKAKRKHTKEVIH